MSGCSRHPDTVPECIACKRVAAAREQLETAADADPHVDWAQLSQRMPWRTASHPPRAFPWWAVAAGLFTTTATAVVVLMMHHPSAPPPPTQHAVAHKAAVGQPPAATPARVTAVAGEVRIETLAQWAALSIGADVQPGARLLSEAGQATLQWGDGTGAILSDKTEVAMAELDVERTLIELNRGEVTLRVAKRKPNQVFAVGTPGHLVEVRGTWFTVARDAGRTTVSVCEGRVAIRTRSGKEEIHLDKGESAAFRDGGIEALPAKRTACVEPWLVPWQKLIEAAPVHIGGAPAELAFDGIRLGPVPAAVLALPGRHKLELSRAGITETRVIAVAPGGTEVKIEKLDLTARAGDIRKSVVFKYQSDLERCWERGIKRDPTLKGRTKLRLQVATDGHVTHAEIFESDVGDIQVEACITTAARTWTFPAGPAVTTETTVDLQ